LRYFKAKIQCVDYGEMLLNPDTNNFVYLDPPYDPVSFTSDFTAYTPNGFGRENQKQLANVFKKLVDKRCLVCQILHLLEDYILILELRKLMYKVLLTVKVQSAQVIRNYLFPTILRISTANKKIMLATETLV